MMAIDNKKDWIDILSALLTPTIAIFAIIVTGMQWWINRKRLKNEYFNRRITVYEAITDYIGHVCTSGGIRANAEMKFLCDTKNVFFLFGSDIKIYVDEIFEKSTDLHALEKMESGLSGDSLKSNLEKQSVIKSWFREELLDSLQGRFKKYLSL